MSTGIQWTDETWNPVVGCTKVSQGCKHCYAKTIHDQRHKAFLAGKPKIAPQYAQPFETVQLMRERLLQPLSWQKPQRVFVNSVSDLFHEDVPNSFLDQVFAVMCLAQRHTFQILTKRQERMRDYLSDPTNELRWAFQACAIYHRKHPRLTAGEAAAYVSDHHPASFPLPNVWLGVSVENQELANQRIPLLLETPAAVRFLSCEPLLGPVDLRRVEAVPDSHRDGKLSRCGIRIDALTGTYLESCVAYPDDRLHWVIVGGESGEKARPCNITWIRDIMAQCKAAGTAVFVKQLGMAVAVPHPGQSYYDGQNFIDDHALWLPHDNHGGDPDEWPADLRVREFPAEAAA